MDSPRQTTRSFLAPIPLVLTIGFVGFFGLGCNDHTTPPDFVGTWQFVDGEAETTIGGDGDSTTEVEDVTGNTFEIELGRGGADLRLILEDFEDCPFDLEVHDNWATGGRARSATSSINQRSTT